MKQREINALGRRFAPDWLRLEVLERDGYRCHYCHRPVTNETANMDHVTPWPWGMTEKGNLKTACRECNREKGLRRRPYKNHRPRRRSTRFHRPAIY